MLNGSVSYTIRKAHKVAYRVIQIEHKCTTFSAYNTFRWKLVELTLSILISENLPWFSIQTFKQHMHLYTSCWSSVP